MPKCQGPSSGRKPDRSRVEVPIVSADVGNRVCPTLISIALLVGLTALAQVARSAAPPLAGNVDGLVMENNQFFVTGWACERGVPEPVSVHIYADHSAYDTPKGTFVIAGAANAPGEPEVARACADSSGGNHRFKLPLSNQTLEVYQGRRLVLHAVHRGGASGSLVIPASPLVFPPPTLGGRYIGPSAHPYVFFSPSELMDLVRRIDTHGSFSATRFAAMANRVRTEVASHVDWGAAYSGCDIDIYLHAFSYESSAGYASDVRTPEQIRAGMGIHGQADPPSGAAPVASRMALYAALLRGGVARPAGGPSEQEAAAVAKKILLAWAAAGFRDEHHAYRKATTQFCDAAGAVAPATQTAVGLQIARGVVYSVNAQDLLQYLGYISAAEAAQLNEFHAAIYELVRNALNYRYEFSKVPCDRFSNHVAAQLTGLLATARLLGDTKGFYAALYGADPSIPVELPWVNFFGKAIYGNGDTPNPCYRNTGPDVTSSHPYFSTEEAAPGEVDDRFRNENPQQGIGYPMSTLEHMTSAAELLRIAGLDPYGYRGPHRQTIEMAIEYYACYARHVGFNKTVDEQGGRECSDYKQYLGRLVNEVDAMILFGTYRFPENRAIVELDGAAKSAFGGLPSIDTIRFGRWVD